MTMSTINIPFCITLIITVVILSGPAKPIAVGVRILDPSNSGNMRGELASLKTTRRIC